MKTAPLRGEPLHLHAIIVSKELPFQQAKHAVRHITQNDKKFFVRITENSYRFRIKPKERFSSFVSKPISDKITLVFGHLRK